ncbi:MAG: hypothetical protein CSYNP_00430 [Syntrophus sp. SKADARSKE-3]|nr:hypothetical protein [Syntrophus sp. SKADARSKE-3]
MHSETMGHLEKIENTMVQESVLGFNPSILFILDDVEVGKKEIEDMKPKLGPEMFAYLFKIANSAYHGSVKMSPVTNFFGVVNRLGMQHTKVLILLFAMHRLAKGSLEAETIYEKSFCASAMGKIMSMEFGLRDDRMRQVELACLLSSIGLMMMTVYRNKYHDGSFDLSADFIEKNHLRFTERIIRRFQFPDYLHGMLMSDCFSLERMGIGLGTVVKLAISAVEYSFKSMGNKLVFSSPSIRANEDRFASSLAGMIEEHFKAAGLSKCLVMTTV